MKFYDLDNLSEFGVTSITSESCGLSMRILYGLTKDAWEHWCHFTGLVQLLDHPRLFLTNRYYSTLVVPREWMKDFLIYLLLQAGYPQVCVLLSREGDGWRLDWQVAVQEGLEDPRFEALLQRRNDAQRRYLVTPWKESEKEHGFRIRHYFSGEIE